MKKKIITIISIAIGIILVIVYFGTVLTGKAKDKDEDILLREYPVSRGDITAGTDGSGSLTVNGAPQNYATSVKLDEVYVKQGDLIAKGDKIAKASQKDLDQNLHDLQIELARAEIALENAKNAKKAGVLETGSSGVEGADANQSKSSAKQKALEEERLANDIVLAQIDVDEIYTKIAKIEQSLSNLILTADRDGLVLEVNYSVGNETGESPVATIGDTKEMYADLQVGQSDIIDILEGQDVELRLDAYPEMTFMGKVISKSHVALKDSNPVMYIVNVSVISEEIELLPGMTCNAQFIIKQAKDVLMLSNKAIKITDGKQVVLLKDDKGELYEQEIETGFSDGKFSEVLSGLEEGQIVYVEG